MTLYAAMEWYSDYEFTADSVLGIYNTRELAQQKIDASFKPGQEYDWEIKEFKVNESW